MRLEKVQVSSKKHCYKLKVCLSILGHSQGLIAGARPLTRSVFTKLFFTLLINGAFANICKTIFSSERVRAVLKSEYCVF